MSSQNQDPFMENAIGYSLGILKLGNAAQWSTRCWAVAAGTGSIPLIIMLRCVSQAAEQQASVSLFHQAEILLRLVG